MCTPRDTSATNVLQPRKGKQDKLGVAGSVWGVSELGNCWGSGAMRNWKLTPGTVQEPRGRKSAIGSHYQATPVKTITDSEDLMCAVVICEVCRTVKA
jgi:hypothetical protein